MWAVPRGIPSILATEPTIMAARNSIRKFSANQAAQAINDLIRLDCEADQQALLDVIDDYFCPPDYHSDSESDDDLMEPTSVDERGV